MSRVPRIALIALVLCTWARAEDVKLREQAVQLMELANAASHPGVLHNFEQSVTFRVHEHDGWAKEETFTRVSAGAAGHRDEYTLGDYRDVIVISGDRISQLIATWKFLPLVCNGNPATVSTDFVLHFQGR